MIEVVHVCAYSDNESRTRTVLMAKKRMMAIGYVRQKVMPKGDEV